MIKTLSISTSTDCCGDEGREFHWEGTFTVHDGPELFQILGRMNIVGLDFDHSEVPLDQEFLNELFARGGLAGGCHDRYASKKTPFFGFKGFNHTAFIPRTGVIGGSQTVIRLKVSQE